MKVIEDACPKVGVGIPDSSGKERLDADQEKPRDELQGGEEYSEHADIEQPLQEHERQVPVSVAQMKVKFSELEQVQKQINLIATMIPTIHDGKKRSGLIKSIAPILEESLDGLLKSLKDADTAEKQEKVVTKAEQEELEDEEADETSEKASSKYRETQKENPRSEGYVRRKKTVTHEKQNGNKIERV